jgi:hypothetical protein
MAKHGLTTALRRRDLMYPATPPRPLDECHRCPEGQNEHFEVDLVELTLVIPIKHGHLHRLEQVDAKLCNKHFTRHLAKKEY